MKRIFGAGVVAAVAAALALPAQAATAASATQPAGGKAASSAATLKGGARTASATAAASSASLAVPSPSVAAAAASLRSQLGAQGIVSIDAATGSPRLVARLDGFLTQPSGGSASSVARGFLAGHSALFGTTKTDVANLAQTRNYVDTDGTHHLAFARRVQGLPVFGQGVQVSVTKAGQVADVVGAPGTATTNDAPVPDLSKEQAVEAALAHEGDHRTLRPGEADSGQLLWFDTGHGLRLAWRVLAEVDSRHVYQSVIDAGTGEVLNTLNTVVSAGKGLHWYYLPDYFDNGAFPLNHGGLTGPAGQQPVTEDFVARGWLANGARTLNGANAHVYADPQDDDRPDPADEIAPNAQGDFTFPFRAVGSCPVATPCSWDSSTAGSWRTNLKQNAAQVFYYVNQFHDHLAAAPIGFTAAAGNFQANGHDAVQAQVFDGADTGGGVPDDNHLDNANMSTGPDGTAPRMQMYLFTGSGFVDSNGGDDASIIYHEYTHGLSHRLVRDANGLPALYGDQANAMGEAWSDWYAMDYIIKDCTTTTPARTDCWDADTFPNQKGHADVWLAQGVSGGSSHEIRTQPLDCLAGDDTETATCTGGSTPHYGGYTYADFGSVSGSGPEVHADGEIWGETLWQLRQAIGSAQYQVSEDLITRAMELSPPNPSFLDERDAILLADQIRYGGAHRATIWSVFAQRGMGWSAKSTGGSDDHPVAAFDLPPTTTGTLSGTVLSSSGGPAAGTLVSVAGHAQLQARSDAIGRYTIPSVPVGSYRLVAAGAGYEPGGTTAATGQPAPTLTLVRDWAALAGGARLTGVSKPDLTGLCPGSESKGAFDLDPGTGWLSTSSTSSQGPKGAKVIIVALPRAIDINGFAVNPTAPCGATPGAAVGRYEVATSVDGKAWFASAAGAFTTRGRFVQLRAAGVTLGVRYVRFTMLASQRADGDGADYMGVTEVSVHGRQSPAGRTDKVAPRVTAAVAAGQTLKTLLASGVRSTVTCSEACVVSETISISPRVARQLRLGTTGLVLGSGSVARNAKGAAVIRVALNRNGRLAVTRTRKLSFTALLVARDAPGNSSRTVIPSVLARTA